MVTKRGTYQTATEEPAATLHVGTQVRPQPNSNFSHPQNTQITTGYESGGGVALLLCAQLTIRMPGT